MDDKQRQLARKVASEIIKKAVDDKAKEKIKKKSLKALSIKENTAMKVGAAVAIGRAVAEKKATIPVNKNTEVELDLNKGKEKIGIFFKKDF